MAWSDLPIDLVSSISSQLPIVDFIRFSVVCTSWNYVVSNNALLGIHFRHSIWLLLPNDAEEASDTLTFYDIANKEEGGLDRHHHLFSLGYDIYGCRCIGSKDGWLVMLSNRDLRPRIFNPLTKAEICLPPLFDMPEEHCYWMNFRMKPDGSFCPNFYPHMSYNCQMYFKKIVFSSNDSFGTAVVIYGLKKLLALAKPDDQAWAPSPQLDPYLALKYFDDVYYHKEEQRFYAITHFSLVLAFDLNGQNVENICPPIHRYLSWDINFDFMNYIFILQGSLLKVQRETKIFRVPGEGRRLKRKTIRISVLKLEPNVITSSSFSEWISVKDLDGFSLFVGCNQTFALHHKVALGIKPNCVYFADHWEEMSAHEADHDFGLFDLQNDCVRYFFDCDSQPDWPPSIWFMPSLS